MPLPCDFSHNWCKLIVLIHLKMLIIKFQRKRGLQGGAAGFDTGGKGGKLGSRQVADSFLSISGVLNKAAPP